MDSELSARDAADVALLTREDADLDALLADAVPPPTCEHAEDEKHEPCGALASWVMASSCGHVVYYCSEHVREMQAFIAQPGSNVCTGGRPARHEPRVVDVRFDRIES